MSNKSEKSNLSCSVSRVKQIILFVIGFGLMQLLIDIKYYTDIPLYRRLKLVDGVSLINSWVMEGPEKISSELSALSSDVFKKTLITQLNQTTNATDKPLCPLESISPTETNKIESEVPDMNVIEKMYPNLQPGGRFTPKNCTSRNKIAIIIPYRDRASQIPIFMYHMHKFLQNQNADYGIYIVEQAGTIPFNRGKLMNIGYIEALQDYDFQCILLHDLDLLPESNKNIYTCPEDAPIHLSSAINKHGYRLPYGAYFGGVTAMSAKQYKTINGFSNKYWGWGGEDDDLNNRVRYHGYDIKRYSPEVSRYTMMSHSKSIPNRNRLRLLYRGSSRYLTDGLNSIKYTVLNKKKYNLYTWIYAYLSIF